MYRILTIEELIVRYFKTDSELDKWNIKTWLHWELGLQKRGEYGKNLYFDIRSGSQVLE